MKLHYYINQVSLLPSGNPENVLLNKQLSSTEVFNLNYIHICFKSVSVCWSKFCGKEIIPMQYLMNCSTSEGRGSPTPYLVFETLPWGKCLSFCSPLSFRVFLLVYGAFVLLQFLISAFPVPPAANHLFLIARSLSFIRSSRSLMYPWFCMNCSFDLTRFISLC